MNTCYWHLSGAAGLNYYYQFCQHGSNDGDDVDHTNIIVDVNKLERNVRFMLNQESTLV
jgi:hypothetical protein